MLTLDSTLPTHMHVYYHLGKKEVNQIYFWQIKKNCVNSKVWLVSFSPKILIKKKNVCHWHIKAGHESFSSHNFSQSVQTTTPQAVSLDSRPTPCTYLWKHTCRSKSIHQPGFAPRAQSRPPRVLSRTTYLCDQRLQQGCRPFAYTTNSEAQASATTLHNPVVSTVLV